jgi:eukaryotic-like serine/threonine-protein kinase
MNFQILNQRMFRSGGNGHLYTGQRSDSGETVVVKFLREFHLPHSRKAFAREIRFLGRRLNGIVPLLAWDTAAARPFYVMPYFKGGSLSKYVGRLTGPQLRSAATELARILANVHAVNDVHGDFKPDNILLTGQGHLQVADPLGNGSFVTILFSQNRGGTPGYMAPEISTGSSVSASADVYSYGATLYHLFTGRMPRHGQRLDQELAASPTDRDICEVISVCCDPDPKARPTMQDVLRMLNHTPWTDILNERKQRDNFAMAVAVLALVFLFGASLRG